MAARFSAIRVVFMSEKSEFAFAVPTMKTPDLKATQFLHAKHESPQILLNPQHFHSIHLLIPLIHSVDLHKVKRDGKKLTTSVSASD